MKPDKNPENNTDTVEDTSRIQQSISQQAINKKLGCVAAFEIATKLNVPPISVGQTLDLMDYRITHCQLGLFGHSPEKKIVTPEKAIGIGLKTALEAATENGRLSCLKAWEIAEQLQIPKIAVSNACEGLGMKIKPCQLGAF